MNWKEKDWIQMRIEAIEDYLKNKNYDVIPPILAEIKRFLIERRGL